MSVHRIAQSCLPLARLLLVVVMVSAVMSCFTNPVAPDVPWVGLLDGSWHATTPDSAVITMQLTESPSLVTGTGRLMSSGTSAVALSVGGWDLLTECQDASCACALLPALVPGIPVGPCNAETVGLLDALAPNVLLDLSTSKRTVRFAGRFQTNADTILGTMTAGDAASTAWLASIGLGTTDSLRFIRR